MILHAIVSFVNMRGVLGHTTAFVTGTGSLDNPSLTKWATQCASDADIASVRAKCVTWKGRSEKFDDKWVDACVSDYCTMVNVKPDCGVDCEAMKMPTSKEMCSGKSCTHYRLGWRMGASWEHTAPKLVRLTGDSSRTKWMILPYIGFHNNFDYSPWEGPEYQEVDLWIEDLGEISNGTVYFDDNGRFSAYNNFGFLFVPDYLRVIKVGADTVTDIGFHPTAQGRQFCKDGPAKCNEAVPTTVTTSRKWYDLVNPEPTCKARGLCPFHDDFDGYGNSVPSWRERKEFTMTNAIRSEPVGWFERYFTRASSEEVQAFLNKCEDPFVPPEFAPPYYFHIGATEGARFKAWDMENVCENGGPDRPNNHFTCPETVAKFNLTDDGFTTRFEAHTSQRCVHPHICDMLPTPRTLSGPKNVSDSMIVISGAGSAEGIGGSPFFGSCGHYHGMMDPERNMAAFGTYPQKDWSSSEPMERYAPPVMIYHHQIFALQTYSNPAFLTYQPISTGSHFIPDTAVTGGEKLVRFMTHYYDPEDAEAPEVVEVIINGAAHKMKLTLGVAARGAYEFDLPSLGDDAPCMSYFFRARNSKGSFTLPQSGEYVYRTYGVGTCREDFAQSTCTGAGCRSTCGFPGSPCAHHDATPGKPSPKPTDYALVGTGICVSGFMGGDPFGSEADCKNKCESETDCGVYCYDTKEGTPNGIWDCLRYSECTGLSTGLKGDSVDAYRCHAKPDAWKRSASSQCHVNTKQFPEDRLDNPIFNGGGFIGTMTLSECQQECMKRRDPRGRPCVAIEMSTHSTDPNTRAKCALAWGCDFTEHWGGGVVYMPPEAQSVPAPSPSNGCAEIETEENCLVAEDGGLNFRPCAWCCGLNCPSTGTKCAPADSLAEGVLRRESGFENCPRYEVGSPGSTCPSAEGVIRSREECEVALKAVGRLDEATFFEEPLNEIPAGCSVRDGGDKVPHFNAIAGIGQGRSDLQPVCIAPHFGLQGTGVAGRHEIWGVDRAHGLGVESCFRAVQADERCHGDFFTYVARGDKNCGCKGDSGALVVRSDRNADHYKIFGAAGGRRRMEMVSKSEDVEIVSPMLRRLLNKH